MSWIPDQVGDDRMRVPSLGKVIGVEVVPKLVGFGQKNLQAYNFPWARIVQADPGVLGFPSEAPYDRILVSASTDTPSQSLIDQLAPQGRMVIPVRESILVVDKSALGKLSTAEYPGFVFVPLV